MPEKIELKQNVFRHVTEKLPKSSLLATNTSSFSITDLQNDVVRPERFLGLHFFNPVHINKLVEVIRGPPSGQMKYGQRLP